MKKRRKHYTPEEKVAILRRHLLERVPISDLCDELGSSQRCSTGGRRSSSKTEPRLSNRGNGPTINPNRNESLIWRGRSRQRMRFWPS